MSYSTDIADLVAKQLSRLTTLNRHQLAGQVVNLDFWLSEVQHVLAVVHGYGVRFTRMHAAQEQHVSAHGTTEFDLDADWDTQRRASPPRRVPGHELEKARRNLTQAAARFLERCRSEGFCRKTSFRRQWRVWAWGGSMPNQRLHLTGAAILVYRASTPLHAAPAA